MKRIASPTVFLNLKVSMVEQNFLNSLIFPNPTDYVCPEEYDLILYFSFTEYPLQYATESALENLSAGRTYRKIDNPPDHPWELIINQIEAEFSSHVDERIITRLKIMKDSLEKSEMKVQEGFDIYDPVFMKNIIQVIRDTTKIFIVFCGISQKSRFSIYSHLRTNVKAGCIHVYCIY